MVAFVTHSPNAVSRDAGAFIEMVGDFEDLQMIRTPSKTSRRSRHHGVRMILTAWERCLPILIFAVSVWNIRLVPLRCSPLK